MVRIEVGNADQRERIAYVTPAGEAAIAAALPHWLKAQKQIAALVQPSAISELADQLDALAVREEGRRREGARAIRKRKIHLGL